MTYKEAAALAASLAASGRLPAAPPAAVEPKQTPEERRAKAKTHARMKRHGADVRLNRDWTAELGGLRGAERAKAREKLRRRDPEYRAMEAAWAKAARERDLEDARRKGREKSARWRAANPDKARAATARRMAEIRAEKACLRAGASLKFQSKFGTV